MLKVAPNVIDQVFKCSRRTEYLTIRAPACSEGSKTELSSESRRQIQVKTGNRTPALLVSDLRSPQGSRLPFVGIGVAGSLIFLVADLFRDCDWLLEIGEGSTRAS